ncbi:MAG: LptF/LptG family permease [Pseudomonadota bacterium]
MTVLARYLSRMFLVYMAVISFGMISILGVLDALSNQDLLPRDAVLVDHLRFMLLRAPLLFERVFVFAFLFSLLVTYVMIIRRNELVGLTAAGLSVMRQIGLLLPGVLLASLLSLAFIDQTTPRAQQGLIDWLGPEAAISSGSTMDDLWVADGNLLVRIRQVTDENLFDLTLVERLERGQVSAITYADSAVAGPEGWELSGVSQVRFDDRQVDPLSNWLSPLSHDTLRLLSMTPRYLSMADLRDLSNLRGSGNRPSAAYEVWLYSRLALPVVAIGFLMMTVSIMQIFERNAKPELTLAWGMGAGILFAVVDSITNSLPENARLDPAVAALSPVAFLLLVGLILAMWRTRT